jgi:hypothetical protein
MVVDLWLPNLVVVVLNLDVVIMFLLTFCAYRGIFMASWRTLFKDLILKNLDGRKRPEIEICVAHVTHNVLMGGGEILLWDHV